MKLKIYINKKLEFLKLGVIKWVKLDRPVGKSMLKEMNQVKNFNLSIYFGPICPIRQFDIGSLAPFF